MSSSLEVAFWPHSLPSLCTAQCPAAILPSQVNHSPSFSTDSWLDKEVKDSLLYDTLVLVNLGSCDKKKVLEEERQRGQFLQQCRSRKTRYSSTSHSPGDPILCDFSAPNKTDLSWSKLRLDSLLVMWPLFHFSESQYSLCEMELMIHKGLRGRLHEVMCTKGLSYCLAL